jgi:hypothetical protein
MSVLASIYTDNLHQNFKTLYGAWPPNASVRLGDYGVLQGNIFVRLANVADTYKLAFQERKDSGRAGNYEYASANSTEVEFHAGASPTAGGVPLKASLDISFSSENAVFFNPASCVPVSIEDQISFGNSIMSLYQTGRWEKKFVVVTGLLESANATVIVSGSNNSSISLEASSDKILNIDLADAALKLGVRRARNVAFKVITQSGLVPLISLSKVQGSIFDDDHFGPQAPRLAAQAVPAQVAEPILLKRPDGDIELFGIFR